MYRALLRSRVPRKRYTSVALGRYARARPAVKYLLTEELSAPTGAGYSHDCASSNLRDGSAAPCVLRRSAAHFLSPDGPDVIVASPVRLDRVRRTT